MLVAICLCQTGRGASYVLPSILVPAFQIHIVLIARMMETLYISAEGVLTHLMVLTCVRGRTFQRIVLILQGQDQSRRVLGKVRASKKEVGNPEFLLATCMYRRILVDV